VWRADGLNTHAQQSVSDVVPQQEEVFHLALQNWKPGFLETCTRTNCKRKREMDLG
jgi:hypothetical protein